MAINENFYNTINGLVSQLGDGTLTAVDYDSFVDSGAKITENPDLQNEFMSALMNKIAESYNIYRTYEGLYKEIYRGDLSYGQTVEIVMHTFYDTQTAPFANLQDGQEYSPFKITKPQVAARYYVESNAFQIQRTISRDQLMKAFTSESAMEEFISTLGGDLINSAERAREAARIGAVSKMASDSMTAQLADGGYKAITTANAKAYDLALGYIAETGAEAIPSLIKGLHDKEFVRYVAASLRAIRGRMKRPTKAFNISGDITTFTPESEQIMVVNSNLAGALSAYLYSSEFHRDDLRVGDYVEAPYWQSEDAPFKISDENFDDGDQPLDILAVIFDRWAVAEFTKTFSVETAPYNPVTRSWNLVLNYEGRVITNPDANFCVIGSSVE